MGAAIAAHLANAGVRVRLLDLPSEGADPDRIAREGFGRALRARPAALMHPRRATLITFGNFRDHLDRLEVDWVIEAVAERLEVKRALLERLDRGEAGPVVSSNSSGIPVALQVQGRSPGFRRRFLGSHFFNPPRYLHLLELIPGADTDPQIVAAVREFAEASLGKGVVVARDVPGFIANRIGIHAMLGVIARMEALGLSPTDVDALSGELVGRPRSATLRTADLAGLDLVLQVAQDLQRSTGDAAGFQIPPLLQRLVSEGRLGEKAGAGFYKRVRQQQGSSVLAFDPASGDYRKQELSPELSALTQRLGSLPLELRVPELWEVPSPGHLLREVLSDPIWYAGQMFGEVSDRLEDIDLAMRWGFGWDIGPFQLYDLLGGQRLARHWQERGLTVPELFARLGQEPCYQGNPACVPALPQGRRPAALPFSLRALRAEPGRALASLADASLLDLGEGVLLLEFHSKGNALGEDALQLWELADRTIRQGDQVGLVIGNQGRQFSAGANLALILMYAQDRDFDLLDQVVRRFQELTSALRSAPYPVVVAAHSQTLGGGCELALHADQVCASAESYLGLVEVGVGLIPAGGGCKEMSLRAWEEAPSGSSLLPALSRRFEALALAKTSGSAEEAIDLGLLRPADLICMNQDQLLLRAKAAVAELLPGYAPKVPTQIGVLGSSGRAALQSGAYQMREAGYISEYDLLLASSLAKVLCGGDLNGQTNLVGAQYLLDLERETFLDLAGRPLTQARIAHLLRTGRPLRN